MKSRRLMVAIFGIIWVTLALAGIFGLTTYSLKSGATAHVPESWPKTTKISRSSALPTLLVFLHPECSCSRATVGELDGLLADLSAPVKTIVVFIRPKGWSDNELKDDLWKSARAIPGVTTLIDSDGLDANAFGALTSGHTALYDVNGSLLFSGGITAARGHSGDNLGAASVVALIETAKTSASRTNVFGCGLFDSEMESKVSRMMVGFTPQFLR